MSYFPLSEIEPNLKFPSTYSNQSRRRHRRRCITPVFDQGGKENFFSRPTDCKEKIPSQLDQIYPKADFPDGNIRSQVFRVYQAFSPDWEEALAEKGTSEAGRKLLSLESGIKTANGSSPRELQLYLSLLEELLERAPKTLLDLFGDCNKGPSREDLQTLLWINLQESLQKAILSPNAASDGTNEHLSWLRDSTVLDDVFGGPVEKASFLQVFTRFQANLLQRGNVLKSQTRQALIQRLFFEFGDIQVWEREAGQIYALLNYLLLPHHHDLLEKFLETEAPFRLKALAQFVLQAGPLGEAAPAWAGELCGSIPEREYQQTQAALFFAELVLGLDEQVDFHACEWVKNILKSQPGGGANFSISSIEELVRLYECLGRKGAEGQSPLQKAFDLALPPKREDLQEALRELIGLSADHTVAKRDIILLVLSQLHGHRQPLVGICTLSAAQIFAAKQKPIRLVEFALRFLSRGEVLFYEEGNNRTSPLPLPVPEFLNEEFLDLFPRCTPAEFLGAPAINKIFDDLGIQAKLLNSTSKMRLSSFAWRVCAAQNLPKEEVDSLTFALLKRLNHLSGRGLSVLLAFTMGQVVINGHKGQLYDDSNHRNSRFDFLRRVSSIIYKAYLEWEPSLEDDSKTGPTPKLSKDDFMDNLSYIASRFLFFQCNSIHLPLQNRGQTTSLYYENNRWKPLSSEDTEKDYHIALQDGIRALIWTGSSFGRFSPASFGRNLGKLFLKLLNSDSDKDTRELTSTLQEFFSLLGKEEWMHIFQMAQKTYLKKSCKAGCHEASQTFFPERMGLWLAVDGYDLKEVLDSSLGQQIEKETASGNTGRELIGNLIPLLLGTASGNRGIFGKSNQNLLPGTIPGHAVNFFTGSPFQRHCIENSLFVPNALQTFFFNPMIEAKSNTASKPQAFFGYIERKLSKNLETRYLESETPDCWRNALTALKNCQKKTCSLSSLLDKLQACFESASQESDKLEQVLENYIFNGIRRLSPFNLFKGKNAPFKKILSSLKVDQAKNSEIQQVFLSEIGCKEGDRKTFFSLEKIVRTFRKALADSGYGEISLEQLEWLICNQINLPYRSPVFDHTWRLEKLSSSSNWVRTFFQASLFKDQEFLFFSEREDGFHGVPLSEVQKVEVFQLPVYTGKNDQSLLSPFLFNTPGKDFPKKLKYLDSPYQPRS